MDKATDPSGAVLRDDPAPAAPGSTNSGPTDSGPTDSGRTVSGPTDSGSTDVEHSDSGRARRRWVTAGWIAHWVLRLWLACTLLVYGWSKVFLMQMGVADYGDALTAFGEMSPMGLLWRFMAYSPVVQVLAGVAEVAAAALLLFRRTAWLGGLLAAAVMAVVFLLNLTYDVPVKQLSLVMTVAGLVVAAPWFAYVGRVLTGRPLPARMLPRPVPWPRLQRVARWAGPLTAIAVLGVSGAGFAVMTGGGAGVAASMPPGLPGVYRVVEDAAPPADQLAEDARWQQVAFGQHGTAHARFALRAANGDFYEGRYSVDGDRVLIDLYPAREGDRPLVREYERTLELTWTRVPAGIELSGDGVDVVLAQDPESRYLFDRGFSWGAATPVNR